MKSKKFLYQQIMETISQSVISFIESLDWTLNESHDTEADDFIAGVTNELRTQLYEYRKKPAGKTYTKQEIKNYLKRHPEIDSKTKLHAKRFKMYKTALDGGFIDELFPESRPYITYAKRDKNEIAKEKAGIDIKKHQADVFNKETNALSNRKENDKEISDLWFPEESPAELLTADFEEFSKNYNTSGIDDVKRAAYKDTIDKFGDVSDYIENKAYDEYYKKKRITPYEKWQEFKEQSYKDANVYFPEHLSYEESEAILRKQFAESIYNDLKKEWYDEYKENIRRYKRKQKETKLDLEKYIKLRYSDVPIAIQSHKKIFGYNPEDFEFSNEYLQDEYFQKMYRKFLVFNDSIDKSVWSPEQFMQMWALKYLKILNLPTDTPVHIDSNK